MRPPAVRRAAATLGACGANRVVDHRLEEGGNAHDDRGCSNSVERDGGLDSHAVVRIAGGSEKRLDSHLGLELAERRGAFASDPGIFVPKRIDHCVNGLRVADPAEHIRGVGSRAAVA